MSISHCRTRRNLVALAATATVATLAGLSSPGLMAQGAFPSKAITMVVPYPPGGSNDVFARQVAKEMGDVLKQTVIVDNRPGASGNTGTAFVAKSTADGYTLVAVSSSMTTNAAVQTKMPFDPVRSLAPVAMFAKGPLVVAVNNEFPAKTPEELVRTIKARPGQFNYATSGTGSINHFATEMMRSMVPGMDIMHVPYKGQGPAVTDVIGIHPAHGAQRQAARHRHHQPQAQPHCARPDAHVHGHPGL
jgi:tripartite-type tricarboxylate transporter receptor subunit TctC